MKRIIWTLWYQGFEQAPPLVNACLESWRRLNPEWQVVALDRDNLRDWIDLSEIIDPARHDLPVVSDAIRLCLLRRYGGVWTDPTVFCLRPLRDWLPLPLPSGFAAFRNPAPDRLMASWFIASERDSRLLAGLHETFIGLMNSRRFSNQNNLFGRVAMALLYRTLRTGTRRTTYWLSPRLQRWVRAYPYLIFHYTFNKIILENPGLASLWQQAAPLDGAQAHRLQTLAREPGGLDAAWRGIEQGGWPVQKLDWRLDLASPYWGPVMQRLTDVVQSNDVVAQIAAE